MVVHETANTTPKIGAQMSNEEIKNFLSNLRAEQENRRSSTSAKTQEKAKGKRGPKAPIKVSDERVARLYKLGDVLSINYVEGAKGRSGEWVIKMYRPSFRPDGKVRFRGNLIVSTGHRIQERARTIAGRLSRKYGIPFEEGIENGSELELKATKKTILAETLSTSSEESESKTGTS
jgi:hypothetical protein